MQPVTEPKHRELARRQELYDRATVVFQQARRLYDEELDRLVRGG